MFRFVNFVIEKKRPVLLVVFTLTLILVFYLRQTGYLEPRKIAMTSSQEPILAPLIFTIVYALLIILLVPTLPLNLVAGFLWGTVGGSLVAWVASAVGAAGCFLISRYLSADFFKKKSQTQIGQIVEAAIKENDWKIIAFTRLNPIFPYGLISYFYGATSISFNRYFWATVLFVLPLVVLFSWMGALLGELALAGAASGSVRNILLLSLAITILLVLKVVMSYKIKTQKLTKMS